MEKNHVFLISQLILAASESASPASKPYKESFVYQHAYFRAEGHSHGT